MRILWLSHLIPYPPKGGVLQRAYHLLKEVARYHSVDLVAFNQPGLLGPLYPTLEEGVEDARKALAACCEQVSILDIDSTQGGFGRERLALRSLISPDPYTINWLKSPVYDAAVRGLLELNEYDLIHFDTISLIPYLHHVKGMPTVLDHHNIKSHMLLRRAENENNLLKKWYFHQEGQRLERVEKQVCPKFSLNITCSEIDAQRLRDIAPGSRVTEIPNGVDISYFKRNCPQTDKPALIFVGTLSWYPNIEAVLFIAEALWPALKKKIPEVVFHIVGANPPDALLSLAGADRNFKVHGFVDDVREYMQESAVYVCPITDGGGTKLKILDALAMEMPIVAHPIACEGIQVTAGENVIFAESVQAYVEAISGLLGNPEQRREMGKQARKLIENTYAYSQIGRGLSEQYEDLAHHFEQGGRR